MVAVRCNDDLRLSIPLKEVLHVWIYAEFFILEITIQTDDKSTNGNTQAKGLDYKEILI